MATKVFSSTFQALTSPLPSGFEAFWRQLINNQPSSCSFAMVGLCSRLSTTPTKLSTRSHFQRQRRVAGSHACSIHELSRFTSRRSRGSCLKWRPSDERCLTRDASWLSLVEIDSNLGISASSTRPGRSSSGLSALVSERRACSRSGRSALGPSNDADSRVLTSMDTTATLLRWRCLCQRLRRSSERWCPSSSLICVARVVLAGTIGGVGASHSGGFAGAAAGASIGLALLGPIGALAGAIAGGIAGAVTGTVVYTAAMRRFDKSFEHCADRAARLELGLPLDEPLTKQRIDARWRRIARYVHSDKLDKDRRNDLFTRLTRHKEALIKSCCEPETAPQAEQHQQQQLLLDSTAEESASQDE